MSSPRSLFTLDLRSLALFRIALASILLLNLGMRWPHIALTLTDQGFLSRELRTSLAPRLEAPTLPPSIHALTGSEAGVKALFVVHAVLALALLLGWRTRIASIGCWIMTMGLTSRNPIAVDGGDNLLALLTFWAMFVPLGAVASLDARAGRGADPDVTSVTSLGSAGLLLQAAYLYIFAGMEKWGEEWGYGGPAFCHMFQIDLFTRPAGRWLLASHPWCHAFPPLVTWGELLGGLAFFCPYRTDRVRLALIGAFALLQLSFLLTIQVTLFPFVSVLSTIPFLPASFWAPDRAARSPTEGAGRELPAHPVANKLAGLAIVLMTLVNLSHIPWLFLDLPEPLDEAIQVVGIYQRWNMYAPSPPVLDGWPVLEATLEDGRTIDLYTGENATFDKPTRVTARFRTFRESMVHFKLIRSTRVQEIAKPYLAYMVNEWNRDHPQGPKVRSARLVVMFEPTLPDCREGLARPNVLAEL